MRFRAEKGFKHEETNKTCTGYGLCLCDDPAAVLAGEDDAVGWRNRTDGAGGV